jgi:hypothetical protein
MKKSNEDHVEWLKWLNDLGKVSVLKISRLRFCQYNISEAEFLELHTFADAGKDAIAVVSYLVATFNGIRFTSFIMSKAKVAPLKMKSKN